MTVLWDESKQLHDYMNDLFNEIAGETPRGDVRDAKQPAGRRLDSGAPRSHASNKSGHKRLEPCSIPFQLIKGGKDD